MEPVRAGCIALIAACFCGLVITSCSRVDPEFAANPPAVSQSSDSVASSDSIEAIVRDATAEGGHVVLCRNHVCIDLGTRDDMGDAQQDGYYVVWPKTDSDYKDKITKYQQRIKSWIEN